MILVTRDIEFGSIIIYPKNSHYGILVMRLPNHYKIKNISKALEEFIISIDTKKLVGYVTVLEIGRYCSRKIN